MHRHNKQKPKIRHTQKENAKRRKLKMRQVRLCSFAFPHFRILNAEKRIYHMTLISQRTFVYLSMFYQQSVQSYIFNLLFVSNYFRHNGDNKVIQMLCSIFSSNFDVDQAFTNSITNRCITCCGNVCSKQITSKHYRNVTIC